MESVWKFGAPGGGIEIIFSLLANGALNGELDVCCTDLSGERLVDADAGGLKTTFLFDEAFLISRSGDDDFVLVVFDVGIGA
jgi:hypothetical protein